MKNNTITRITGLVCLMAGLTLQAQTHQDTFSVRLIGCGRGESTALRWAPLDLKTWEAGIDQGYQLERITLSLDGRPLDPSAQEKSRIVLSPRIRPLPEPDWEALADTNQLAVIAAGSLYSNTFNINPGSSDPEGNLEDAGTVAENRFGFGLFAADQFLEIAVAMGLGWVDKTVDPTGIYRYQVTLAEPPPQGVVDPGSATVRTSETRILPVPGELSAQFGDQKVRLKWNRSKTAHFYTSWQVERSWDGGISFEPANRYPLIYTSQGEIEDPFVHFTDTLRKNEVEVLYRVRGKTPFGEWGPPSIPISGAGRPGPIPYRPVITGLRELEQPALAVEWRVPPAAEGQVRQFDVYRAKDAGGPFIRLNPEPLDPATLRFVDPAPEHLNYYQVRLTDQNGHEIPGQARLSLLRDETPPDPPQPISGRWLPGEEIELLWRASGAPDCSGYRVYASRTYHGDYLQVTGHALTDTLFRMLSTPGAVSEKIFFRIKAIDYRGNYSALSEPVEVGLPDKIPPPPPVFKSIRSGTEGILVTWANSSGKDVARQELQQKNTEADEWKTLLMLEKSDTVTRYFDREPQPGASRMYRLAAFDETGLVSYSKAVVGKRINTGILGEIAGFKARRDPDGRYIALVWEYKQMAEVRDFILYRSDGKTSVSVYQALKPESPQLELTGRLARFKDLAVQKNSRYRYQLIARLQDGGWSKLSPEIEISF